MIDHTGIVVSNLRASKAFYGAALAPIGYELLVEVSQAMNNRADTVGFGVPPKVEFWLINGIPNVPPVHVAFRVFKHAMVNAFHAAAVQAGGRDNGGPGVRPFYHPYYYAAFVLDPDGHNIEVVCHEGE